MWKPVPIPPGEEVEMLAVAMAAVDGHFWPGLSQERAAAYRRWANAAILRMGSRQDLFGGAEAAAAVARQTDKLADEIRAAAQQLEDAPGVPESTIVSLFRAANQVVDIGFVLTGKQQDEEQF